MKHYEMLIFIFSSIPDTIGMGSVEMATNIAPSCSVDHTYARKKTIPEFQAPESEACEFPVSEFPEQSEIEVVEEERPTDELRSGDAFQNKEQKSTSVTNCKTLLFDKPTQTDVQNLMTMITSSTRKDELSRENGRKNHMEWLEEKERRLKYYTGFNFQEMAVLLEFLGPDIESIRMWRSASLRPRCGAIPAKAKLYLTLERLRHAFGLVDLGERYGISREWCGKIFITMCGFMFEKFAVLKEKMLVRKERHQPLPLPFRNCLLQNVRVDIDCTEVFVQSSADFRQQGLLYSNYKHHTTAKVLIGVAPCGAAMFVSEAYEGAISDKEIVAHSGFLSFIMPGDEVLADRGFTIQEELAEKGAKLIIPPFLQGRNHFSKEEVSVAKKIARARIHVERFNQRLKHYKILSGIVPPNLVPLLSKIVFICCCLVNFQEPLCK